MPSVDQVLGGGARIEARRAAMFRPIAENIDQCIAYFAWCSKSVRIVPVAPDGAGDLEKTVEMTGDPHGETLHSLREMLAIGGLDEQVDVIGLHAEMKNAKKPDTRGTDLRQNAAEQQLGAEARQAPADTDGNVQWMTERVHRPRQVRNTGSGPIRLATGATTAPCPGAPQGEGKLARTHKNYLAHII
jgi:hypothetical protein